MIEIIASIFLLSGTTFMLIASVGIIRLPDFYIRMSVVTKASTVGLALLLTGIGIYFDTLDIIIKVIAIAVFIVLSSPISSHIIVKAASFIRVPFWDKTDLSDYLKAEETPDDPKKASHKYGKSSR